MHVPNRHIHDLAKWKLQYLCIPVFQNAHVLQAVLILIRELDKDSLEIVNSATQKMLHSGDS